MWSPDPRPLVRRLAPFTLCLLAAALLLAGCGLDQVTGSTAATSAPLPTATSLPQATAAAAAPSATAASGGNQPLAATAPAGSGGAATTATAGTAGSTAAASGQPAAGAGLPDVAAVAAKVRPATVLIVNLGQGQARGPGGMPGGSEVQQGAGTGFIYDPAGYIITNNHVVEGAQRLKVVLPPPDNREFDAQLVGRDPQTDLAVVKIDIQNPPTVPLGNSSDLKIGEWVVAIGNALALPGGPTVTAGVVSALGRDAIEPGSTPGSRGPTLYDLIQTDAAINPGNSGGPLVNLRGEVVGVNTLGAADAQGIGFAISIDGAKAIVEQLRQNGRVARGYLGVTLQSVTPAVAATNGLPRTDGVAVLDVVPGSPAAQAGLQSGDLIYGIDDVPVASQRDLQVALTNRLRPGDTVTLKVNRGGAERTVKVTLGERPSSSARATGGA